MSKKVTQFLLIFIFGLFSNFLYAQGPYLTINQNSYNNLIEGNSVSLQLNLSRTTSAPVVVNITTISQTAGTSDFIPVNTIITIPAGQSASNYFSIATTNDAIIEPTETFIVKALVLSGNTSNIDAKEEVYITDNDTPPTVNAYVQSSAVEGIPNVTIYYNLSNVYNSNVTIHCVTSNGTAVSSDFTAINSTITIPAGRTVASIQIPINDDALTEPNEIFVLTGTVTTGNTANTIVPVTVEIIDNDTFPTVSISDISVTEGRTQTLSAILDRPYNSNVVVNFTSVPGTADNSDFTITNITQTILAGDTSASVSIPTTDDTLDEPVESFMVNVNVTSANTTNNSVSAQVKIIDNDGLPDLSVYKVNNYSNVQSGLLYEGDTASFNIRTSTPSATDIIVNVVTSPGTASNTDFTPVNTTVTIPAGQNFVSVDVPTTFDSLLEGTENFTFTATVTSGNTFNATSSLVVDILDNYNIKAIHDEFSITAGSTGNLSVIANDTYHGAAVNASDVSISLEPNAMGVTLDAQGILHIPDSVGQGYYDFNYTVCELANPSHCDTATVLLNVSSPLTLTYTRTYQDFNGDGYVSVGDVFNVTFTLGNIGIFPITNIEPDLYMSNNLVFTGGPIVSLAPGASDSTTFTAQIIITQDIINNGSASFTPRFFGYYNSNLVDKVIDSSFIVSRDGIKLIAFIDSNNNGIKEAIEPYFRYGSFNYSINGGSLHHIYCNSSYYLYESNPTNVYDLSYTVYPSYATYNTCTITYPNVTVPVGSVFTNYYFPIATTAFEDLGVNMVPWVNEPRPGVVWNNYISYSNNSNQPVASGTVTFNKDPALTITNISQPNAVANFNGFSYNFTNLAPYETRYINVELLVPPIPTVALGQLLSNTVSITMPSGDVYPYNNNFVVTRAVVGSFDPNNISESHGERILHSSFTSDDYLTYTIRFENTGTANAINIKIEDVLDNKLDPSTIRIVDSSNPYVLERVDSNLLFRFNAINLMPSIQDTMIGKGYITFQVKPRPGYAVGDVIPNSASIYFDTNPAIITNTFNTRFVNTLSDEDFVFSGFSHYPNPVKNTLNLTNSSTIDEVSVVSILGQQILIQKINALETELDMSSFSKGVYFIKVLSGGLVKTVKIVKE